MKISPYVYPLLNTIDVETVGTFKTKTVDTFKDKNAEEIFNIVVNHFQLAKNDIFNGRRKDKALARRILFYFLKKFKSYNDIVEWVNNLPNYYFGKDRYSYGAISSAVFKLTYEMKTYEKVNKLVKIIEEKIEKSSF